MFRRFGVGVVTNLYHISQCIHVSGGKPVASIDEFTEVHLVLSLFFLGEGSKTSLMGEIPLGFILRNYVVLLWSSECCLNNLSEPVNWFRELGHR